MIRRALSVFACFAVLLISTGLISSGGANAETPVADPARVSAAQELMEVTGVTKQMDGMIDAMVSGFQRGANAEGNAGGQQMSDVFKASMEKFKSYKQDMLKDFALLYAERFTVEEMKAVTDFYRGGPGAKFIQLMPDLMQAGAAIGMKYSQKMIEDMKAAPPVPAPAP